MNITILRNADIHYKTARGRILEHCDIGTNHYDSLSVMSR